jgi:alpha-ribazole phosphatase
MKVYLIRHSTTKGNLEGRYVGSTDESLCEEGIHKAKDKVMEQVAKVYVSPLLRCIETANIVYKNIEQAIIPGLRETDFGEFEYKNYLDLDGNSDYQTWIDSGGKSGFPKGESFEHAYQRAIDTFLFIIRDAKKNHYKSIAIVTHGGTIMSIMDQFSNEKRDYYDWHVKNCEGFMLEIDGG